MAGPASGIPSMPYLAPISPYVMPFERFDNLIGAYGIGLYWMKNHNCPCTFASQTPGSPDPQCTSCFGRGVYWDNPIGPFQSLITFIHTSPTPDEPGTMVDPDQGLAINGEPTLSLGYSLQTQVWEQASIYDAFVEANAISLYTARLIKGQQESVPYQQALSVAATGAVRTYDTTTHSVVSGVPYTVSGTSVTLGSGFPDGTNYTCEFSAAPTWIAYRVAGMPAHIRPFGGLTLPRRFRLQTLDYWTRARFPGDLPRVL